MNHFKKFQEALEIEQKSENTFTLIPNTNYFVGNTPHGGYLMAVMHRALTIFASLNSNQFFCAIP
ncbi:MAG: hypothetical protein Ct9H90mP22_5420 [Gammaproteobacteria bacterium]|nr:MAG: hypothetical protein Ct9H90mP22_5420 [Gammaproteobacteria bacterium]